MSACSVTLRRRVRAKAGRALARSERYVRPPAPASIHATFKGAKREKMKRSRFLVPVLASLALLCGCTSAPRSQERAAVEACVVDYFQGLKTADRDRIERAFAEEVAVMIGPKAAGGSLVRYEIPGVIDRWAGNPNPPGESDDYEILSVEIVDERLATVTFRFTDRYYDAFLLIKHDGEWQIVTKAFVERRDGSARSESRDSS